jgi:hypothetical protein
MIKIPGIIRIVYSEHDVMAGYIKKKEQAKYSGAELGNIIIVALPHLASLTSHGSRRDGMHRNFRAASS